MSVILRQWDVVKVRVNPEDLTAFDCVFFPVVRKTAISKKLGSVSANRRRILHQTIAGALRLFQ